MIERLLQWTGVPKIIFWGCLMLGYPVMFGIFYFGFKLEPTWSIAGALIFGDAPGILAAWLIGRVISR